MNFMSLFRTAHFGYFSLQIKLGGIYWSASEEKKRTAKLLFYSSECVWDLCFSPTGAHARRNKSV